MAPVNWITERRTRQRSGEFAILRARAIADADERSETIIDDATRALARSLTGRLKSAPIIQPYDEMFNAAVKVIRKIKPRDDIRKESERAGNKSARVMDTLMKELGGKVNAYKKAFPVFKNLHPFEMSLLDLSIGTASYARILQSVDDLKKELTQVRPAFLFLLLECRIAVQTPPPFTSEFVFKIK